jgi:hypothetical protein
MTNYMSHPTKPPSFDGFSRWLAARLDRPEMRAERHETLKDAARMARDEFVESRRPFAQKPATGRIEALYLLAAADKTDATLPPEITTTRGFRIALAFDADAAPGESSICVLVHCPVDLIGSFEGQLVHLWYGEDRFEIGQFDAEGKALGLLPPHIRIRPSDFAEGRVKLEEPPLTAD